MSTERNKWIDAVGKLLQLTQDGELKWEAHQPPAHLIDRPDKYVEAVFVTNYKDRTLRLYELHYKLEITTGYPIGSFLIGSRKPEYSWHKQTALELVDKSGLSTWTFPETEVLDHLLAAVRYQVTGVKDFLQEVLTGA